MLEIKIKRFFKITHVLSSVVWHLQGEIFDVPIENLNKVRRLKKIQRVIAEKKTFKWEINIKVRN